MAQVDFTNAHIQPYGNNPIYEQGDAGLANVTNFYNSSGTAIATVSKSVITDDPKKLVFNLSGTFSASGTEFYIGTSGSDFVYRVFNIHFSNGDTFIFRFNANIV